MTRLIVNRQERPFARGIAKSRGDLLEDLDERSRGEGGS
jgi:hypothetical protein